MLQRWSGAPLVPPTAEPPPSAGPLERWKVAATAALAMVALAGGAFWLARRPLDRPVVLPTIAVEQGVVRELKVHIAGAVAVPGLYSLGDGSRVADAVERAGGALEGADLARVNLAQRLRDGQQVIVPRLGAPASGAAPTARAAGAVSGSTAAAVGGSPVQNPAARATRVPTPAIGSPMNLNRASQAELETLPGIGAATAGRIIRFSEQRGPFASIEAFRAARLVSASTWERIKDMVELP